MPVLNKTAGADFERTHIPPGIYSAKLRDITVFQMDDQKNPGQKVDRLRWSFVVASKKTGEEKVIEGITSTAWGPGVPGKTVAKAWRWAEQLLCETPPEMGFDTDVLHNLVGNIKVADKQRGEEVYSIVEDVVPPAGEF